MNPIFNIDLNKHPMSWEPIHQHLLHPSESVMKSIYCQQNLTGIPKQCTKKTIQAPGIRCYIEKMTTFPKGKTVDKTNLKPGELIHMYFSFHNVTSIQVFTSMHTVVCEKTRTIWLFTNSSKISPGHIIILI